MSDIDWESVSNFEALLEIDSELSPTDFDEWANCPDRLLADCLRELRDLLSPHKQVSANVLKGASGAAIFTQDWMRAIWAKRAIDSPSSDLYGCDHERMGNFIESQTQPLIVEKAVARGWQTDVIHERIEMLITEDFIGDASDVANSISGLLYLTALRCRAKSLDQRMFGPLIFACIESPCYHRAGLHEDADDVTSWILSEQAGIVDGFTPDEKEMLGQGLMRIRSESSEHSRLHRTICETCLGLFAEGSEDLADCMYWLSELMIKEREFAEADELLDRLSAIAKNGDMNELLAMANVSRAVIEAEVTGDASALESANIWEGSGFALGETMAAYGDAATKMQAGKELSLSDLANLVEKIDSGISALNVDDVGGASIFGHYVELVRILCALEQSTIASLIAAVEASGKFKGFAKSEDIQDMDSLLATVKSFGKLIKDNDGIS